MFDLRFTRGFDCKIFPMSKNIAMMN